MGRTIKKLEKKGANPTEINDDLKIVIGKSNHSLTQSHSNLLGKVPRQPIALPNNHDQPLGRLRGGTGNSLWESVCQCVDKVRQGTAPSNCQVPVCHT